jgi:hypothetical protein
MRCSSIFITALATGASLVFAMPIEEQSAVTDLDILNYALTLEYPERKFYLEGLQKFQHSDFVNAGFPDPFYANLGTIYSDEQVSVSHYCH